MVAIFAGTGAGFERGSGSVLGKVGLLGGSALGRGGENVFVNAANGNLLINRQDEFLVGRGPDVAIARTYNSLADAGDDNNDNWRQSTDRRVFDLVGPFNSWGSSVKRVAGDGSVVTYSWDGTAYVATDGAGAYDKLTHSGGVWTWTDGDSQITETYHSYVADLRAIGWPVSSVWDLVNTRQSYPEAVPVLMAHLDRPYDPRIREGISARLRCPRREGRRRAGSWMSSSGRAMRTGMSAGRSPTP